MMDYFTLRTRAKAGGILEVYPNFKITARDIVAKGGDFYAVYDEATGLWSRDQETVIKHVDTALSEYVRDNPRTIAQYLDDSNSGSWLAYKRYISSKPQSDITFDEKLLFSNHKLSRKDHATRTLSYYPEEGCTEAFNHILSTLYGPSEIDKIKWFIGALLSGDSKKIQKFAVFFGAAGTGKSTVINIIERLVEGYGATFKAKDLVSSNNQFGTAAFKHNPLLAVQHDDDLSRIEDNSTLNALISHETVIVNEKYKGQYDFKFNGLIILGTNKPVKITDSKSGLLRRLLDIIPSGITLPYEEYIVYTEKVKYETAAIAWECIEQYRRMGKSYYMNHKPFKMMELTDFFYDFVLENVTTLRQGITLTHAVKLYVQYCESNKLDVKAPRQKVRQQLEDYFKGFEPEMVLNDERIRDFYYDFDESKVTAVKYNPDDDPTSMAMSTPTSYLDNFAVDWKAQYATKDGTPSQKWMSVTSTISNIDTSKLHYAKPPQNIVVVDFDLKGEDGKKDMVKNIKAASLFPPTYGEFSQGGSGVHLYYTYDGDISELSNMYDEDIEIKTFRGGAAIRRRFTYSNGINVVSLLSPGFLPLKERKDNVIDENIHWNENSLRKTITKALNKEHHGSTAPEIDYIEKVLSDAIKDNIEFNLNDMRPSVLAFAMRSTNQKKKCMEKVAKMVFSTIKEEDLDPGIFDTRDPGILPDEKLVFYDVEVFPNLFVVVFKRYGTNNKITYYNPTAQQMHELCKYPLVGFNNRKYDNHMIYAASMGYTPEQLYDLSQRIINKSPNAMFPNAYNMSYADIFEYSSTKQSLKKWEIEMGVTHDECEFPWDEPVPKEHWERVGEYCGHDVDATEALFDHIRYDYDARCIIAELSGLPINAKTQSHAEAFIFEGNKNPQEEFIYTDLSEMFPGYKYEFGKSIYRGEDPSEGGYIYTEPGVYDDVGLFDIASQHPNSGRALQCFGKYTKNYTDLVDIRLAVKHKDLELAKSIRNDDRLNKYLNDLDKAKKLSYALKIIINIVYGMTSAKYDNAFKDPRNIDNILAKRGALFMIDLKHAVQEQGYTVVHIKTDSIKIANADDYIWKFVYDFGIKYGYTFEHEDTYQKFCLLNKAYYYGLSKDGHWETKGTTPNHPYVYKRLMTQEPLDIPKDVCEIKESKTGPIYIGDRFVGRLVHAVPVTTEFGQELTVLRDGKSASVSGAKGYKWILASEFETRGYTIDDVDLRYFDNMCIDLINNTNKVGSYKQALPYELLDSKYLVDEDVPFY